MSNHVHSPPRQRHHAGNARECETSAHKCVEPSDSHGVRRRSRHQHTNYDKKAHHLRQGLPDHQWQWLFLQQETGGHHLDTRNGKQVGGQDQQAPCHAIFHTQTQQCPSRHAKHGQHGAEQAEHEGWPNPAHGMPAFPTENLQPECLQAKCSQRRDDVDRRKGCHEDSVLARPKDTRSQHLSQERQTGPCEGKDADD